MVPPQTCRKFVHTPQMCEKDFALPLLHSCAIVFKVEYPKMLCCPPVNIKKNSSYS